MFIKKINQIDITEKLQTSLLPILWIEEVGHAPVATIEDIDLTITKIVFSSLGSLQGIELNEAMQSMLKWKLVYILIALDLLYYAMIFGGFLTFAACLIWYFVRRNQENKVIPLN